MDLSTDCTCWRVPDEYGHLLPNCWAVMHDEVKVVCHDGREVTGFSLGAEWWGPASDPRVMLEVEAVDAADLVVGIDEVATVTPLGGHEDFEEFAAMVANAVRAASLSGQVDGDPMILIIGSHSTLEVTLAVTDHPCCPQTIGPPQESL